MKDQETGFLALILTGILMMVIGISLMMSAVRTPDGSGAGIADHAAKQPASLFALLSPSR